MRNMMISSPSREFFLELAEIDSISTLRMYLMIQEVQLANEANIIFSLSIQHIQKMQVLETISLTKALNSLLSNKSILTTVRLEDIKNSFELFKQGVSLVLIFKMSFSYFPT